MGLGDGVLWSIPTGGICSRQTEIELDRIGTDGSDDSCNITRNLLDTITVHPGSIASNYDPFLRTVVYASRITRFLLTSADIDLWRIYGGFLVKVLDLYPSRHADKRYRISNLICSRCYDRWEEWSRSSLIPHLSLYLFRYACCGGLMFKDDRDLEGKDGWYACSPDSWYFDTHTPSFYSHPSKEIT